MFDRDNVSRVVCVITLIILASLVMFFAFSFEHAVETMFRATEIIVDTCK